MLVVSFAAMVLLDFVPGGPGAALAGERGTAERIAAIEKTLDLDRPLPIRYVEWLGDVVTGDLGRSYRTQQPVFETITERLPVSLELATLSLLVALLIAVPLGLYSGYRPEGWVDRIVTLLSSIMLSVPSFVIALTLVFVLSIRMSLLPVTGWVRISTDLGEHLRHIALPVLTLALAEAALFVRLLRNDMATTMQQDFVLSARARGLRARRVVVRHALRPSSFSLVTVLGVSLGKLISGSIIVEIIFSLPGIGQLVISSIQSRDLIMVRGVVIFVAFGYVIVNALTDLVYPLLDPRLRSDRVAAVDPVPGA